MHASYGSTDGGCGIVAKRYLWQQIVTAAKQGRPGAPGNSAPKLCPFRSKTAIKCSSFNKYCAGNHIRVDLEGTTRYPNMRMGLMAGADLLAMFSGQVLKLFTL